MATVKSLKKRVDSLHKMVFEDQLKVDVTKEDYQLLTGLLSTVDDVSSKLTSIKKSLSAEMLAKEQKSNSAMLAQAGIDMSPHDALKLFIQNYHRNQE